jgi:hypothetical protein
MPDQQLTGAPQPATIGPVGPAAGWRRPLRLLLRALAVVAVMAAAGALAGVVWEWWWAPPGGVVLHHQWVQFETDVRHDFSGTGTYVVVAVVAGAVVAAAIALLVDGAEVLTLVAVLGGSLLAGWLMHRVGVALGPPDPDPLAASAADGTHLPSNLVVSGDTTWRAFPAGALAGLVIVWLGLSSKKARSRGPDR